MRSFAYRYAGSECLHVADHAGPCGDHSGKQQALGSISTGLRRIRAEYDTAESERFSLVDKILPAVDSAASSGGHHRLIFAVRPTKLDRRGHSSTLQHCAVSFCDID